MKSKFISCMTLATFWLIMYFVFDKDTYLILSSVWCVGAIITGGER